MSREYEALMQKIAGVVENRTISLPPKKALAYEKGQYHPVFSLIDRGGELLCMWCSNRKMPDRNGEGGDVEIIRVRNIEEGFDTDADSPRSW